MDRRNFLQGFLGIGLTSCLAGTSRAISKAHIAFGVTWSLATPTKEGQYLKLNTGVGGPTTVYITEFQGRLFPDPTVFRNHLWYGPIGDASNG